MKYKCLFLEGDMQIGKSTTILKNLKAMISPDFIGGFMCQRLVESNQTKAFCLTDFNKVEATIVEYRPDISNIFLENASGKWVRNDDVFNNIGIEMLKNLSSKKIIVLDEIGGFELLVGNFRQNLYEVLLSDILIIGVLKSNKNKSIMKNAVEVDDNYITLYQQLRVDIENKYEGKILTASKDNMLSIQREICGFLNEI